MLPLFTRLMSLKLPFFSCKCT